VDYTFIVSQVIDDLIPPESGVRLFRGTCELRICLHEDEIARRTIKSRVISSKQAEPPLEEITSNLKTQAMRTSYEIFSKTFDDIN